MGGAWDRFTNPVTQKQTGFWRAFLLIALGIGALAIAVDIAIRVLAGI